MATEQQRAPVPLSGAYAALEPDVGALVREVLRWRDPDLHARLGRDTDVSEDDVRRVETAFYHEFVQNLHEDWAPTEYGERVDKAIGAFLTRFPIERDG